MNISSEKHLEDLSSSPLKAKSPQNVGVRQVSGPRMSVKTNTYTRTHIARQYLVLRMLPTKVFDNLTGNKENARNISFSECNTILSAYTKYRHLG